MGNYNTLWNKVNSLVYAILYIWILQMIRKQTELFYPDVCGNSILYSHGVKYTSLQPTGA